MNRLGTAQLDRLAHHRTAALDVLLPASAAYDGRTPLRETQEGAALLAQPAEQLVSVAVSAVAAVVESRRRQGERAAGSEAVDRETTDAFAAELLAALARRRLPFRRADVELLLDLGASTMDRERPSVRSFESLSFAVSAAENLLRVEGVTASLLEALERAGAAIDALGPAPRSRGGEIRRRIRSIAAAQVPGGLLDLVVVDPRDAWAAPARELLRTHAERWDGIQGFVALIARARGTRPTLGWRREAAAAAAYDGLGDLLRGLLEPLLRIDLSTSGMAHPPRWLLAPENETLVKGAVWASAFVDAPWVVPLLGRLALRGAAPSPHATVTTAQSLPLAGAAVETLAAIASPQAMRELHTLLAEIRRRDLLKRIAAIVGEPAAETRARDERIRREKRRAVKLRADPGPQDRQRRATAAVRRSLAPLLREAGFADSAGRTFWRDLDDRVETVHCRADSDGLTLAVGIWFSFVPRATPAAERHGRPRPTERACDLRGSVRASDDDLERAGGRALAWLDRWRPLPALLRWLLIGAPSPETYAQGARGSTDHALLTGYVALRAGEQAVARRQLRQAAAALRESLEATRPGGGDAARSLEALVARIEADADL